MPNWTDPQKSIAREVLKVLCTESYMEMPLDELYRKTGLNTYAVDSVVEQIAETGLVDHNDGWIRIMRIAVIKALGAELKIESY